MEITEKNVRFVLERALAEHWGSSIPIVHARLRLAINSLLDQEGGVFNGDPQDLILILRKKQNSGIRQILEENDVEAVAFAIRDALN